MNTNTPDVRPANLADWMLARGRSSATTAELSELLGLAPELVRVRLNPYVHRGQWVSPARRLWVPVPVEYRLWGAPEGIEVIDTMMRHLDVLYYVGWLTAAALHGAAHHAPQVFQVAVSRHVADREVGRTKFRFATRQNLPALPVIERTTRSGVARVATPEVTVLDLASDLALAGGIDNAATVILGLAEDRLDVVALAELSRIFPAAAVRRAGWILETIGGRDDLQPLVEATQSRKEAASLLTAPGPKSGTMDRRWSLRVNADVDAEF